MNDKSLDPTWAALQGERPKFTIGAPPGFEDMEPHIPPPPLIPAQPRVVKEGWVFKRGKLLHLWIALRLTNK